MKFGGDAEEPDRLRVAAILSRADARDEEATEYVDVMPFIAGEEVCDGLVETDVALGDEAR